MYRDQITFRCAKCGSKKFDIPANLSRANFRSRSDGQLIQAAAVRLPLILTEADHPATDISGFAGGRRAAQRRMNPISVVVVPEVQQLPFEISGAPKRDWIRELSPYRADQSLNERMR